MLGGRRPGGLHDALGDVGLVLHERPVVGDEQEEGAGVGGEELPDDERMLERLLACHLEASRRRRTARQDRLGEPEDVEGRGAVEPGHPRHGVERLEPLDHVPQRRRPLAREHARALHHEDRVGPPQRRPPAAAGTPLPRPGRLGPGRPRRPSRHSGRRFLRRSIPLGPSLPPAAVPGPLGPARIAVAGDRQGREPHGEEETQPRAVDERPEGASRGGEPRRCGMGGAGGGPALGGRFARHRRPRMARIASSRVIRPSPSASRSEKE